MGFQDFYGMVQKKVLEISKSNMKSQILIRVIINTYDIPSSVTCKGRYVNRSVRSW